MQPALQYVSVHSYCDQPTDCCRTLAGDLLKTGCGGARTGCGRAGGPHPHDGNYALKFRRMHCMWKYAIYMPALHVGNDSSLAPASCRVDDCTHCICIQGQAPADHGPVLLLCCALTETHETETMKIYHLLVSPYGITSLGVICISRKTGSFLPSYKHPSLWRHPPDVATTSSVANTLPNRFSRYSFAWRLRF